MKKLFKKNLLKKLLKTNLSIPKSQKKLSKINIFFDKLFLFKKIPKILPHIKNPFIIKTNKKNQNICQSTTWS